MLVMAIWGPPAGADSFQEEYAVKAALVFNFARFTEWPEGTFSSQDEPMELVVFGDKDLKSPFQSLDGKKVADHPIVVRWTNRPDEVDSCHVLFLAGNQRDLWPQVRAAIADHSVLTIGEMNGFLESGGVMNLHLSNNKVRFQVNLDHMRENSLQISSQVLKLASMIQDKGQ